MGLVVRTLNNVHFIILYIANIGNYLGAVKRWGEELTVENRANKEYMFFLRKKNRQFHILLIPDVLISRFE